MIQPSLEIVFRGFWRWYQCKTFLASGICDFVSSFSEKGYATGVQLKKRQNPTFWLKNCHFWAKIAHLTILTPLNGILYANFAPWPQEGNSRDFLSQVWKVKIFFPPRVRLWKGSKMIIFKPKSHIWPYWLPWMAFSMLILHYHVKFISDFVPPYWAWHLVKISWS